VTPTAEVGGAPGHEGVPTIGTNDSAPGADTNFAREGPDRGACADHTAVARIVADTARLEQSYAASVICERAELNQSAVLRLEADSAALAQSSSAVVTAKAARMEGSAAGVVVAENVSGGEVYCAVLSAERVEGNVRCLVDQWWLAAVGGAALGLALALTEWLLRRPKG
jgi:hypothetical protein